MPRSQIFTIPAPTQGLVTNTPSGAGQINTARAMENFFPSSAGVSPRGGTNLRVSVPSAIVNIFDYNYGGKKRHFVATDTAIYGFDSDTPDGTVLDVPDVDGLASGRFCVVAMENREGTFLLCFNGVDHARMYDGTDWTEVDSYDIVDAEGDTAGSLPAGNVDFLWVYDNRLILLEKGSLNAYALPAGEVDGVVTDIPALTSVFARGSYLVSGGVWSSDSGSGIDDRCIFLANSGEVAVYTGDPDAETGPNAWQLAGIFDIGRPISKYGSFRIGGDWCVATDTGIIPMQAVLGRDVGALSVVSLTRPIEDEWKRAIAKTSEQLREDWHVIRWEDRDMLLIAPATVSGDKDSFLFVANTQNNAWTRFTGWNVNAFGVLDQILFYGSHQGDLFQCDYGGTDNGEPFICRLCTEFTNCNNFGSFKVVGGIRPTWKYNTTVDIESCVAMDHNTTFRHAPTIGSFVTYAPLWDLAHWDGVEWAGDLVDDYRAKWQVVSGHGSWLAYQAQLASNHGERVDCTLLSVEISYTTGTAFN